MTNAVDKETLARYIEKLKHLSDLVDKMISFGFDVNSEVIDGMNKAMEFIIELISFIIEDSDDWIEYFQFECYFGKKPQEVIITHYLEKRKYLLDSIDTFVDFLIREC